MNIFTAFNRAIANSGAFEILSRPNSKHRAAMRAAKERSQAIATTRIQWRDALQVDETAAWMSTYEQRPDVLRGLCAVLGLCALAKQYDAGSDDSAEVRVIRGAISAAEQAGKAGCVLTPDTVQALSSAATMAKQIVESCTAEAIEFACTYFNQFVAQQGS